MQQTTNISTWTRLSRKRSAVIALYTIGLACLIAIFAYPLSPDNSPNANRTLLELAGRSPGYTRQFLVLPPEAPVVKKPFISRLFTGTPVSNRLLPINSYYFTRDSIIVEHYIRDSFMHTMAFPLSSLVPARLRRPAEQQPYVVSNRIQKNTFILGTDKYGRDILSRLLIGTRVSLAAGLIAVLLSLGIGLVLGAIAGYFDGWFDKVLIYLLDILSVVPNLLLVFALSLAIGTGFWQLLLAIGLTMCVSTTRSIREKVLEVRNKEYIEAAKTLGLSDLRILIHHVLPNIAGRILVIASNSFAAAILLEAGLSFLGIGVQPPVPSWGLMVREHYPFLLSQHPILAIMPGIAIVVLAGAFNVLGNALSSVLDISDK